VRLVKRRKYKRINARVLKLCVQQSVSHPTPFAFTSARHSTRNRQTSELPFSDHQCRADRSLLQEQRIQKRERRSDQRMRFEIVRIECRECHTPCLSHSHLPCTPPKIERLRHAPFRSTNAEGTDHCDNVRLVKRRKYKRINARVLKLCVQQSVSHPTPFAFTSARHSTRNRQTSELPFSDHQCRADRSLLQEQRIQKRERRSDQRMRFEIVRIECRECHTPCLSHSHLPCTPREVDTFQHDLWHTTNGEETCNCKNMRLVNIWKFERHRIQMCVLKSTVSHPTPFAFTSARHSTRIRHIAK
jgi:hypothetical protein